MGDVPSCNIWTLRKKGNMKKEKHVSLFVCIASIIVSVVPITSKAADKVVVIPLGTSRAGSESWLDGAGKVTTAADVGIGVTTPAAKLDINGGIKIGEDNSPCDSSKAGIIRWKSGVFEGCNGGKWIALSPVPTVYSSGHEWMDRNLGARRVAEGPNDSLAFGDLYQWGRFADGHENRSSPTTSTLSIGDDPGHGDFIVTGEVDRVGWRNPANDNLWQESSINNPCPTGFRLPTQEEWYTEIQSWSSQDTAGGFASPLKLVLAGQRNFEGTVEGTGEEGFYWSSTGSSIIDPISGFPIADAAYMFFHNSGAYFSTDYRRYGMSIRCIKD